MKRLSLLSLILFVCVRMCFAQAGYRVPGNVSDTLLSTPLAYSSIVLLRSADTVIETFARAADDGNFSLVVSKPGKCIVQVSRPGYADYTDMLILTDTLTDIGVVPMLSKEHILEEFVFTQQVAAIKIKGDTTEYMADSFMLKAGALP